MAKDSRGSGELQGDDRGHWSPIGNDIIEQMRNAKVSPMARAVYMELVSYAKRRSRICWPSKQTLADNVGASRRSVQAAIAELKVAGVVWEITREKAKALICQSGERETTMPRPDRTPIFYRVPVHIPRERDEADCTPQSRGETECADGVQPAAHEPEEGNQTNLRPELRRSDKVSGPAPSQSLFPEDGTADPKTNHEFKIKGGDLWTLPKRLADELADECRNRIDLDAELRRAAQWCEVNPAKRKTAAGMPRFLRGWIGRAIRDAEGRHSTGTGWTGGAPQLGTFEATREQKEEIRRRYAEKKERGN